MKTVNTFGFYLFVLTLFVSFTSCFKDNEYDDPASELDLPVIAINTNGSSIVDDPKITARMQVQSPSVEFDGYIGIEIRGTTSQMFKKKSFNLETRTNSGENLNVSLLGLPAENDWVLYGPYSDKSLMRNVLAYHLGNLMGRWSPRTKFCELFINEEYRGVYVLTEKIKRDKNRVNIATLNSGEIAGDDITGGYILKIDRPNLGFWVSPYKARGNRQDVPISYVDPKYAELAPEQRLYIKNYVTSFENALWGENFKDPDIGYRAYVNMTSFVDYYLLNELSRNLDAYRVSTYFYKDKDSNGGKLTMGPFWDYNLAFGNADFFNAGKTDGWVVDGLGYGDAYGIPFWWDRLREDPYFEAQLKLRWNELRSVKFSNKSLFEFIDSCITSLTFAQKRNFEKFPILNTYVWPNNYIGGTYINEVNYLKSWINFRLLWMDAQLK